MSKKYDFQVMVNGEAVPGLKVCGVELTPDMVIEFPDFDVEKGDAVTIRGSEQSTIEEVTE